MESSRYLQKTLDARHAADLNTCRTVAVTSSPGKRRGSFDGLKMTTSPHIRTNLLDLPEREVARGAGSGPGLWEQR